MYAFPILGVLAVVFGVLFLFSPDTLTRLSEWFNRTLVNNDQAAFRNRKIVGVILILAGAYFLIVSAKYVFR
ncbi:MAG: hypothetical protein A2V83_07535 [Nitrospirae bacterium RBG_16_64_22]|nr:MAG: hypothetical protein A2V83_07535 [Nitrospirae bacterium RBG_16_64_22]